MSEITFKDTGIFIEDSPDRVIGSFNFGEATCNICNRNTEDECICRDCRESLKQIIYEYKHRNDPVNDFQIANEEE